MHAGRRSIDRSLCCLQFSADKPAKLAAFRSALEPLRQTLKHSKFLGGNKLNYADIAVAGNFLVHIGNHMHTNAGILDDICDIAAGVYIFISLQLLAFFGL